MAQNSNEFRPTHPKGDFFDLKGQNTKVSTEITAGITTFFAMAYIIIVNPNMLQQTGMLGALYSWPRLLLRLSVH